MDNNFNNIFDDLTPLKQNARYATQSCDLFFNPEKGKNGKFEVSDALFRKLDLNNNGFVVVTGHGRAFVGIVPNEQAITYAGRTDSENKSDEFTSTTMREALEAIGLEGNMYWLTKAGTKDGVDYYEIVTTDPKASQEAEVESGDQEQEDAPVTATQEAVADPDSF